MNPVMVMTTSGRKRWCDPAKIDPWLSRIPQGKFAGKHFVETAEPLRNITVVLHTL